VLTLRDIQAHLAEIHGTQVSPDLISRIADAVLDDVKAWQTRPLDGVYAIVCRRECSTSAMPRNRE